jgi:2-dehydro-3-deoxygalactonokinase
MGGAQFIGGDWGTTHLRLFLCDAEGTALESRNGPGAAEVGGRFADIFASETAAWDAQYGSLPAVLCGMVGSSIGWFQAPYVPCPARLEQIASACVAIAANQMAAPQNASTRDGGRPIRIVPGLSCQNPLHAPDVLRGEETQILGAMGMLEPLRTGRQLVCLPGTHTKWVTVEAGQVHDFFTAPTGELFSLLRDYSVLVRGANHAELDAEAFNRALTSVAQQSNAQILHRLFECRGRPLSGEFPATAASAYLSGLLIGSDVVGALQVLSASGFAPRTVVLIGDPQLTRLYATACATFGLYAQEVDGAEAVLAGLLNIYHRLSLGV